MKQEQTLKCRAEPGRRIKKSSALSDLAVAVILHGGAPMELPWLDKVSAFLMMYLGGSSVGSATINLLTGAACPCGKLAETWLKKVQDNPSFINFPRGCRKSQVWRGNLYRLQVL